VRVPDAALDEVRDRGFVLVEGFLAAEELKAAQEALWLHFPTPEDYFSDPSRYAEYAASQFAGVLEFPYRSWDLNRLAFHPDLVDAAERFLGTAELHLYKVELWAKYAGAVNYEQPLHRDYGSHSLVVPRRDHRYHEHAPESLLRAHVETRGGDLLALVPGLGRRLADVNESRSADPESERHLLFGSVLDLLSRTTSTTPVLLVVDDLHWADRPSLQLLRHVVAGSMDLRLLILGTFRSGDVGADDALAEVLASLHREPGVERLSLRGLDDLELLALMQTIAGHEMTDDGVALRDALLRETDGNPFFVLEILRHLAETGAITQTDDGRWVAHLDLSTQGLPVSVREVIGRRVHRLGPAATRVLSAASVIGRDFDLAVLSSVSEVDEDDLLDILDAAAGAALISDAPGMPGRFTFVHALIERALYDELRPARRQRLHRRIAEALEALPGDPDEHVGELAHHWYAATQPADVDKAFRYSIAAGDRAQRRLAPEEAVRWYTQALDLVDRLEPGARDPQRCDLWLRLGTAQRFAGLPEFRQTLLDAADLAMRLGDTDRLVEAALTNTRSFAASIGRLDAERISVLRGALDAIGTSSPETRARLLAQWAAETMWGPEYDTDELIDEALALTETSEDVDARGRSLYALYQYFAPTNLGTRQAREAEILELASHVDPALQCRIYNILVHAALQGGDVDKAQEFLRENARLAEISGDPTQLWQAAWLQANLALLNGDVETGERLADAALQIAMDGGQPDGLIIYGAQLIEMRMLDGRQAEICDLVAQTAEENPGIPAFRASLATLLVASGRQREAEVLLDEFVAEIPSLWVDPTWTSTLSQLADAAGIIRHEDIARAVGPLLAPYTDQWAWTGANDWGPIALNLAIARTVCGEYEEADADFAHARALAEKARCPYQGARAALEWATMLERRGAAGDDERAGALLDSTLEVASAHGFAGLERRARALKD